MDNAKCIKPDQCGCQQSDGIYYQANQKLTNPNCTLECSCSSESHQFHCINISCATNNSYCGFKDNHYSCHCNSGFIGDGMNSCIDINECEMAKDKSPLCHENAECINIEGSYLCQCKSGYEGDGKNKCININECLNSPCSIEGQDERSVECNDLDPGYNCLCKPGFTRNKLGICEDKNECEDTGNLCDRVSTLCNNTFGSYRCECKQGFRSSPTESYVCTDVNECHQVHDCDKKFAKCVNTPGSYYCRCNPGYRGFDGRNCSEIDECAESLSPLCHPEEGECFNLPGSYECRCKSDSSVGCHGKTPCDDVVCNKSHEYCYMGRCECNKGYQKNPDSSQCEDIDECLTSQHDCVNKKAECVNLEGSYHCNCLPGYRPSPEPPYMCQNVDECHEKRANCSKNSQCIDVIGGYFCECPTGYIGHCDECRDIDECSTGVDSCDKETAECINIEGSYKCKCQSGYEGNGQICVDIDECSLGIDKCNRSNHQLCSNKLGSYECICDSGYGYQSTETGSATSSLSSSPNISGQCVDIDECMLYHDNGCHKHARCINLPGNYRCQCIEGFQGDGIKKCRPEKGRQLCGDQLCSVNSECRNNQCVCNDGFHYSPTDSSKCIDINECETVNICDIKAQCINLQGSYKCLCNDKYIDVGNNICLPKSQLNNIKNRCSIDGFCVNGQCQDGICRCNRPGYFLSQDGDDCEDRRCQVMSPCPSDSTCSIDSLEEIRCLCNEGLTWDSASSSCIDVDECQLEIDDCQDNSICENVRGSFKCRCPSNDGAPNHYIDVLDDGKICIKRPEEDNCLDKSLCNKPGQYCHNNQCKCLSGLTSNGTDCVKYTKDCTSNTCPLNSNCRERLLGYLCECAPGYSQMGTSSCLDIDECALDQHKCNHRTSKCVNSPGSYTCQCKQKFAFNSKSGECELDKSKCHCGAKGICDKDGLCICAEGYQINKQGICQDIDECSDVSTNNCHILADCINLPGSYRCQCPNNYYGQPTVQCFEDKCSLKTLECSTQEICINTIKGSACIPSNVKCNDDQQLVNNTCVPKEDLSECGVSKCPANSYCNSTLSLCQCLPGYQGDGASCTDINECSDESSKAALCPALSRCINLPGSYTCQCLLGYQPSEADSSICEDIDECSSSPCSHNARCDNTPGSYFCSCRPGYIGDGNIQCLPDIKCSTHNGCHNNGKCVPSNDGSGGYQCRCLSGYQGNGIDDCTKNDLCFANNKSLCHSNAHCQQINTTYQCICPAGYQGDGYQICEDVDECSNSLENICSNQLEKCINTIGSYVCMCVDGARDINGTCEDINECEGQGYSKCSPFANCNNTIGGHQCSCKSGFRGNGIICQDIDECADGLADCDSNTAQCINTVGSFDCECQAGTVGNGTSCVDVDECESTNATTAPLNHCDPNSDCINESPGYKCECKPGYDGTGWFCARANPCNNPKACNITANETCVRQSGIKDGFQCLCKTGHSRTESVQPCLPINPCSSGTHTCNKTSEKCVYHPDTSTYSCECSEGFTKPDGAEECQDNDECDPNSPHYQATECSASGGECLNVPSSFVCLCPQNNNHSMACEPLDLCKLNMDNCDKSKEDCQDISGKSEFKCICKQGYQKSVTNKCEDIDECKISNHSCHGNATCQNTIGSYKCICDAKTQLDSTGKICIDINECELDPFICGDYAKCVNKIDGFSCQCITGFKWINDSCHDIDECADPEENPCHENAECSNIPGSCTCKCRPGFNGDGRYHCSEVSKCPQEMIAACPNNSHCVKHPDQKYTCECDSPNYRLDPNDPGCTTSESGSLCVQQCLDVDECRTKSRACHLNAKCINNQGSYTCECPPHLQGDGKMRCEDRNECINGENQCNLTTSVCVNYDNCVNPQNHYDCKCLPGFKQDPADPHNCVNINECSGVEPDVICGSRNTECHDSDGGFWCKCKKGYEVSFSSMDSMCADVDECSRDTDLCGAHTHCANTPGGYICLCDEGYRSDSNTSCVDIDECQVHDNICNATLLHSKCINTAGSYSCVCPPGLEQRDQICADVNECESSVSRGACSSINNTRCINTWSGYQCVCTSSAMKQLWPNGPCELVNQCAEKLDVCEKLNGPSSKCIDLDDNEVVGKVDYNGYACECPSGYTNDLDNNRPHLCVDIDECSAALHNCSVVSSKCVNTPGSFQCECRSGWRSVVSEGRTSCVDIDECAVSPLICGSRGDDGRPAGKCINTPGGYMCRCTEGHTVGKQRFCVDIDECEEPTSSELSAECASDKHAKCTNLLGSYSCRCLPGYQYDNQTHSCQDINECTKYANVCDRRNSYCINEAGSFKCECLQGFERVSQGNRCVDIDECSVLDNVCGAPSDIGGYCENLPGSYQCRCQAGYHQSNPQSPCQPVDVCHNVTCLNPNTYCLATDPNNVLSGYQCVCNPGYKLNSMGLCTNVNECLEEDLPCHYLARCIDLDGSYTCECHPGYYGDGRGSCQAICHSDSCPGNQLCQINSNSTGGSSVNTADNYKCTCECPSTTPASIVCSESGQVCGTDHHSYQSARQLFKASCSSSPGAKAAVTAIEYYHSCKDDCSQVICPSNQKCTMVNAQPKCSCIPCSDKELQPRTLCSNNGIQFDSICHMKQWICDTHLSIDISYDGPCKRPIDCHLSEWSAWSSCSKSCGIGRTTRLRSLLAPAKYNGQCDDSTVQSRQCSLGPCDNDVCEYNVSCAIGAFCEPITGRCLCPDCSDITSDDSPVCGYIIGGETVASDNHASTYRSLCTLQHNACMLRADSYHMVNEGSCDKPVKKPVLCALSTQMELVSFATLVHQQKQYTNCTSNQPIELNQCLGGCNLDQCCRPTTTTKLKVKFICQSFDNKQSVVIYYQVESADMCQCINEQTIHEY